MKNIIALALGVVVLAGLVFFVGTKLFAAQLGERGFKRAVEQQVGRDVIGELGPGLHVITVGTGSPLPDPARAGPMTAVVAGGKLFIVDAGSGAVRKLGQFALPVGDTEAALLTHFHSDHIDGLGELMLQRWANGGHDTPLQVIGAPGVSQVVEGYNMAYALDATYRTAHHGEEVVPPSGFGGTAVTFDLPEAGAATTVYDADGVTITMFAVLHDPVHPAVGYRFDHAGRSVVLSGDTAYSTAVVTSATGTDLLVHEALSPEMVAVIGARAEERGLDRAAKIMSDIPSYHATPAEAARTAKEAGVGMLVLSHLVPAVPDKRLVPYFLGRASEEWDGRIVVAEDGDVYSLRPDETGVERSDLR